MEMRVEDVPEVSEVVPEVPGNLSEVPPVDCVRVSPEVAGTVTPAVSVGMAETEDTVYQLTETELNELVESLMAERSQQAGPQPVAKTSVPESKKKSKEPRPVQQSPSTIMTSLKGIATAFTMDVIKGMAVASTPLLLGLALDRVRASSRGLAGPSAQASAPSKEYHGQLHEPLFR
jgi:hypothetical protein